ncbi:hypothetical protein [Paenibacillus alkalitolerans]|uniref:hypothetical protein n=1 Tax=Paenibacillus alkalitolerans TaxID=2799335 RepID=UPI0018F48119|nr:hypothetical protein [Paenibacillus alkalitolerans]
MIEEIFGKPAFPLVVDDCFLIIRNDKFIPIDKVYLFTKARRFPVRAFGELWMTDSITDLKKFTGFFTCRFDLEFMKDQTEHYTIQSNPKDKKPIYKFNGVSLSRINNVEHRITNVKFNCFDYEITFDH